MRKRQSKRMKSQTGNPSASSMYDWYAKDSALINSAANIPWTYVTGIPFTANYFGTIKAEQYVAPGVMAIPIIPILGEASKPTSPINVAAMATYSYVRHAVSGGKNYEPIDLIMYEYAMSNVYSMINHLCRIYRTASLFSQVNRYVPKTLLGAMGVNPDSVMNNMANFRYSVNLLINKAASFAVPDSMSLFKRQASMFTNVYIESDSMRDQFYLLKPGAYYIYNEIGTEEAPYPVLEIQPVTWTNTTNATDIIAAVNSMVEALLESQSIGNISGDIKAAYGESIIKLSPLEDQTNFVPVFDRYMLEQIMNATCGMFYAGTPSQAAAQAGIYFSNITQNPNTVENPQGNYLTQEWHSVLSAGAQMNYQEKFANTHFHDLFKMNRVLRTHEVSTSVETTVQNTRLMAGLTSSLEICAGTEVAGAAEIWTFEGNEVTSYQLMTTRYLETATVEGPLNGSYEDMNTFNRVMNYVATFKYCPMIYRIKMTGDGTNVTSLIEQHLSSLENYTEVSMDTLSTIHNACVLSEFSVPSISKI